MESGGERSLAHASLSLETFLQLSFFLVRSAAHWVGAALVCGRRISNMSFEFPGFATLTFATCYAWPAARRRLSAIQVGGWWRGEALHFPRQCGKNILRFVCLVSDTSIILRPQLLRLLLLLPVYNQHMFKPWLCQAGWPERVPKPAGVAWGLSRTAHSTAKICVPGAGSASRNYYMWVCVSFVCR